MPERAWGFESPLSHQHAADPAPTAKQRCALRNRRAGARAIRLGMLWMLVAVLLILWLLGFSLHVAGSLIHILLVVALIAIIYNLVANRRRV